MKLVLGLLISMFAGAALAQGTSFASPAGKTCLRGKIAQLRAEISAAPERRDELVRLSGALYEACWEGMRPMAGCTGAGLLKCAVKKHAQVVSAGYAANARMGHLGIDERAAFFFAIGLKKAEAWDACIARTLAILGPKLNPDSENPDVMKQLVAEQWTHAVCDAILISQAIAVVEGLILYAEVAQ